LRWLRRLVVLIAVILLAVHGFDGISFVIALKMHQNVHVIF